MATQKLIPAPKGADHEGITAPLPPTAAAALAHAEETLAGMLAARYASTAKTYRDLSGSTGWMAPGEFDRLADVQDELAMRRKRLADTGRLDLIEGAVRVAPEVQRAVTVYEVASERYQELTTLSRELTGAELDSLGLAQDRMADARQTLAAAGHLDLIEAGQ